MHSHKDQLLPSTVIVASCRQVSTEVSGDTVILDMNSGRYFGLNSIGGFVWSLVQEPVSIETIIRKVMREYDVAEDKARRDVMALINEMIEVELVHVVNSEPVATRS